MKTVATKLEGKHILCSKIRLPKIRHLRGYRAALLIARPFYIPQVQYSCGTVFRHFSELNRPFRYSVEDSSLNEIFILGVSKKFTRLAVFEIKSMRPTVKAEMLIYQ